ncbi:MAG: hypothetical protein E7478_09115 [Ruminococcaceae bacterium]|nr:hypothetical protein [Oscillospiraceae bacterium]
MKIGKYPVKHTYSIARIIADIISVGLAVLIVSATINFFVRYDKFLGYIMTDKGHATMLAHDPYYQTKQWLALIFPVLMLAVFVAYIILVLKSHRFSRYNITKRNAQQVSDAYTFCVSLCKIPVLIIITDTMAITQDKLLPQYGFGWFSWPVLLYTIILLIIIRYTRHRIDNITAAPTAESSSDAIKVKAVVSQKRSADEQPAENNKEEV